MIQRSCRELMKYSVSLVPFIPPVITTATTKGDGRCSTQHRQMKTFGKITSYWNILLIFFLINWSMYQWEEINTAQTDWKKFSRNCEAILGQASQICLHIWRVNIFDISTFKLFDTEAAHHKKWRAKQISIGLFWYSLCACRSMICWFLVP